MHLENSNAKSRRAFTLMEMVVVVVVIGIISAMIIPEMKGTFDDALLRSTGRELMNVFSLASSRAVSFNQSCRVQLDTQTGRYLVERQVRDGGREDFVPLKDVSGAEGRLDPRIAVEIRQSGEDSAGNNSDDRASGAKFAGRRCILSRRHGGRGGNPAARPRRFSTRPAIEPGHGARPGHRAGTRMNALQHNAGFSLIEVMVAILILGVALAGLAHGIATALGSSKESEWQTTAALFAAGKIETLRAEGGLENGETTGDCGAGLEAYRWKQTIGGTDIDGLHDVAVVVENAQDGREIYELKTLLFEPAGAAADQDAKSKTKRSGGK